MANVLLTNKCNRSCPYCFAEKEMAASPSGERLSWENLIYVADFLERSGIRHISLLGGEPTLHPDVVDFILYLIERRFNVTIFTNGVLSETRLGEVEEHLTSIAVDRLTFVCNLNDPEQTPTPPELARRIHTFLGIMGPWTGPGFNVYRLDYRLEFLFELVNRYGMRRHLRFGITHPIPGADNSCIRPEQIGQVIERLYSYRHQLDRFRIKPGLDCGFPICRFTDEQLGWLTRLTGRSHFACGPAIDIAPDMSVYCCFPFSEYHRRSLFEFDSFGQVADYYSELMNHLRHELPGIYDECDGCVHRDEGICDGGGACQLLNRFTREAPVRLPEIEHEIQKLRLPS